MHDLRSARPRKPRRSNPADLRFQRERAGDILPTPPTIFLQASPMRVIRRPFSVVVACLTISAVAAAESIAPPVSAGRFVVRGLVELDPELVTRSLEADDELLLLTSPLATRKALLAAVSQRVTWAVQRQGYAAARASARIEAGDGGDTIVIDVDQGSRQEAAGIEIEGFPEELAGQLRNWLKSQRPPPAAVPQSIDADDGWRGTRWLDSRGQPVRMESPLWSRGQPAAFDAPHLAAIRVAIGRFLREQGYFAAARLLDKPPGRGADAPRIDVSIRADSAGAVLVIAADHLPPPSVLARIDVTPAAHTVAVQAALGVAVGRRVTELDRLAWQETLRQSGRFLKSDVKFKELPSEAGGAPGIAATFNLESYPHVPPLGQPLSREEEAVLCVRGWLLRTLANEDDLVLSWTKPSATATGVSTGELIVSTREGVLLTALPGNPHACGAAVSAAGLGWFLPDDDGWFQVPLPTRSRLTVNVALFLAETVHTGRHAYIGRYALDTRIEQRPRDAVAALAITARIEPVACLAFLHDGNPKVTWEGDDLVVARADITARIDSRTGRLVSLTLPDGGRIDIDAAPGRFAARLAELREAAGPDRTRPDALVSSGIDFFTSAGLVTAAERLVDAAGSLPGVPAATLVAWQTPAGVVADKLRRTVAAGGFAAADAATAAAVARATEAAALPRLELPTNTPPPPDADPTTRLARTAAPWAWRTLERASGRDSWLTALARLGTLASRHDAGAIWELSAYLSSARFGPLAYLAAASASPLPSATLSLVARGEQRLTAGAFCSDCDAAVAVLRQGGLDAPLVSLLRTLDDEEAARLGETVLRDRQSILPLVHALRASDSDAAALAAITSTLDRWWSQSLGRTITAALSGQAAPLQTAEAPSPTPAAVR